jgi:hypothetical protein
MEIVYKKVNDLIPYINNSRTHSEEQINQIVGSINEFGFTNPLLIDEKDNIIAGHGRLLASKKLKMEEVPCIVLSGLTEAQKKAYIIADNKMALNAGWDEELLKIELENLKELDFDLELTGFNVDELEDIFQVEEEQEIVEDDFEWYGDKAQSNIWQISREINREEQGNHPTPKPIELIAKALNNSSKQEDIVLDVFGGSGSTLIACEQLNRNCYMMELDPKYVDVIIQRWEKFTGKKAIKLN